uniref:Ribosomal protein L1 n=1 Tax=Ophirina amphinema TaxID=2108040 RepID=A0A348AYP8_9EUKA|nr:ribosomal protein L1 [Ophirina amphinema]
MVLDCLKEVDSFNSKNIRSVSLCVNLSNRADVSSYNRGLSSQIQLDNLISQDVSFLCFAENPIVVDQKVKLVQGGDDLVNEIRSGKVQVDGFEYCLATPGMMKSVMKIGSILGPYGLMPNKRLGTISQDLSTAVQNIFAGYTVLRCTKSRQVYVHLCYDIKNLNDLGSDVCKVLGRIQDGSYSKTRFSPISSAFLSIHGGPSFQII